MIFIKVIMIFFHFDKLVFGYNDIRTNFEEYITIIIKVIMNCHDYLSDRWTNETQVQESMNIIHICQLFINKKILIIHKSIGWLNRIQRKWSKISSIFEISITHFNFLDVLLPSKFIFLYFLYWLVIGGKNTSFRRVRMWEHFKFW